MSQADLLLAVMALAVGLALAWRSVPAARAALFVSALLVAGLLFLPGSQLAALAGEDALGGLTRLAARTPWTVSDWMHFVIFAWLGLLLWLGRPDLRGWKGLGAIVVLAVAAELAQGLSADREPRVDDVLLNLVGGAVGVALGLAVRAMRRRGRADTPG